MHLLKEIFEDVKEGHEAIFDNDFLKYLKKNDRGAYELTILARIAVIIGTPIVILLGISILFMPILIFLGLLAC